jgi:hypothetical protein
LGHKHEVYIITVPYKGSKVERKYNDFVNLRSNLIKFYPGYIISSLPKKPPQKFTPEVLTKYKNKLQNFLNELFDHPLLKRSYILCQFVLEKNYKKFQKAKKKMSKDESPKCVTQCFSTEGAVDVSFDGLLESKCEEMDNGLSNLQKDFTRFLYYSP